MTTEIDGIRINYRDEGEGGDGRPALLLLHGWGANTDLFDGIYKLASGSYRVVGPDFPGCGGSAEPSEPMELDDYVKFVEKFVSAVMPDEKELICLGHSHGGRVLIHAAAGGRDLGGAAITKLILVDSAGIVPERSSEQKAKTARYKRYKAILTKTGIARIAPGALDKLQRKFGSADYAAASPVMRQTMVKVVNADLRDEMPLVRQPVLLIWGAEDKDTPLSDGKKMEELMPEAGLAVIPAVGHFSFLENPYHFNRILGSFLGIEI